MSFRNAWPALAATLALGGCGNLVRSEQPLFTAADEAGAPAFRQGTWLGEDPDCVFNETRPQTAWPACAEPFVLGPEGLKDQKLMEGPDSRVAAGDPLILQMGDASGFNYVALVVTKTDRRRRATAFSAWSVLCGPPPTAAPGESPPQKVTFHPLPGLEVRGGDCFARDAATVRRAAAASQAWNEEKVAAHWVRGPGR